MENLENLIDEKLEADLASAQSAGPIPEGESTPELEAAQATLREGLVRKAHTDSFRRLYPIGYKRFEAVAGMTWHVHEEASKTIHRLIAKCGLGKHLWNRVENQFLNRYGLTRWRGNMVEPFIGNSLTEPAFAGGGIYIQNELRPTEGGGYARAGFEEVTEDFLQTLDSKYNPTVEGMKKFCVKWQTIADDLQKAHGVDQKTIDLLASDATDAAGRRRIESDVDGGELPGTRGPGAPVGYGAQGAPIGADPAG